MTAEVSFRKVVIALENIYHNWSPGEDVALLRFLV
jgi:hypothetical protein